LDKTISHRRNIVEEKVIGDAGDFVGDVISSNAALHDSVGIMVQSY
jgi:hypothetical protein